MNTSSLAAVVVLFHPTQEMIDCVLGYAGFLGHVVLVDNTEPARPVAFKSIPSVTYLPMGTNRGLGDALNAGVECAAGLGFHSVVLLDQDSVLTRQATAAACAAIADDVGIVALRQSLHRERGEAGLQRSDARSGCVDVPVTMTSGSILNVHAYRACGPFDTKLFIDYVDHDYCLRLRRGGYRIVQCLHAALEHELGEPKTVRLAGRSVSFVTHRPFRSYYIVRNGMYVVTRYFTDDPKAAFGVIKVLFKEFVKAVAFENEKASRLGYMGLGLWHWLFGRYGRVVQP